jgi:ssDNA-binding Zn-finger/Zn-ribbon topoisomerase 1
MRRPLAIDLYAGLGGWSAGFLAEGWDCMGFDIERHQYAKKCPTCDGTGNFYRHDEDGDFLECDCYEDLDNYGKVWERYPAQLVLQDVLTLHGSQFRNADCIVASPPCQAYSYRAMPWKRAKALPPPSNELFDACFRIQREACEAAGRHIPLVVENVKGAQPWVGRAAWHYGSFYLWGDVPALMPPTLSAQKFNPDGTAHGQGSWFAIADSKNRGSQKNNGGSWFAVANNTMSGHSQNPDGRKVLVYSDPRRNGGRGVHLTNPHENLNGVKQAGHSGRAWFADLDVAGHFSSKSLSRKAASAQIAKIPFPLAQWIAQVFKPDCVPQEAT